jgi:hypothetical protein
LPCRWGTAQIFFRECQMFFSFPCMRPSLTHPWLFLRLCVLRLLCPNQCLFWHLRPRSCPCEGCRISAATPYH